jgi:diguanylate cyclase (GGDEF)-like protein
MALVHLRRLATPLLLLAAAAFLYAQVGGLRPAYRQLVTEAPFVTAGIALLLGLFFNRSRIFVASLALLAMAWVVSTRLAPGFADPRGLVLYSLLSLFVPLTGLVLVLAPEHGLRSNSGHWLLLLIPAQVVAGWVVMRYAVGAAAALVLDWMPPRVHESWALSMPASVLFAAALVIALWRLLRHGSEDLAALTAWLIFALAVLAAYDEPGFAPVALAASMIPAAASLVRSSHELAYYDQLTGILGRRALDERLDALGRNFTIAMLDVDHFKQFNDTYGHETGDDVLKMVAAQIARVGGGGTAYRYGGEEFSIVFPGRGLRESLPFLEEVRRNVEAYQLVLRDHKSRNVPKKVAEERRGRRRLPRNETVSVTISIGVAEANKHHSTPQEVIEAADKALYRAKQKGRNCISR